LALLQAEPEHWVHAANLALLGAVRSGAQHAMDWDGVPAEVIEVLDAGLGHWAPPGLELATGFE